MFIYMLRCAAEDEHQGRQQCRTHPWKQCLVAFTSAQEGIMRCLERVPGRQMQGPLPGLSPDLGDLEDLRFDIFSKRAAAGSIKPEELPPTTGAAAQHSLQAYLQTRDWLLLQSPSLDVLEYGWKQGKQGYAPVPTTDPQHRTTF